MNIEMKGSGFLFVCKIKNEWNVLTLLDCYGKYDVPKGTIDKGEKILIAAKRECFEETSINVDTNINIIKTWDDWDKDSNCYLFSKSSKGLALYLSECNYELLQDINIVPNKKTNIVEHEKAFFTTFYDFYLNSPNYLGEYIFLAKEKIENNEQRTNKY